jgi:hypothetical protein
MAPKSCPFCNEPETHRALNPGRHAPDDVLIRKIVIRLPGWSIIRDVGVVPIIWWTSWPSGCDSCHPEYLSGCIGFDDMVLWELRRRIEVKIEFLNFSKSKSWTDLKKRLASRILAVRMKYFGAKKWFLANSASPDWRELINLGPAWTNRKLKKISLEGSSKLIKITILHPQINYLKLIIT